MKPGTRRLIWLGIFFFILYMYIVYLPVDYDFDGTVFSHFLRRAVIQDDIKTVIQPHHLYYFPVSFVLYKLTASLSGAQILEYFFLQMLSLLFGLLSLILVYKIVDRLTPALDFYYKAAAILLIAFSSVFWYYATEAEVHMPGLFFILAGVYCLLSSRNRWWRLILSALFFALSAGFHLTNGLICLSAFLFLIYRRSGVKKIILFIASYALFLLVPLWALSRSAGIALPQWAREVLFGANPFSGYPLSRWNSFSPKTLLATVETSANSLILTGSPLLNIMATVLFIGLVVLVAWGARRLTDRRFLYLSLSWILPFFLFFAFWMTRATEFKLIPLIPFLILVVMVSARAKRQTAARIGTACLVIVVFLLNFFTTVRPNSRIENNHRYGLSQSISEKTPQNATIVIAGAGRGAYAYGKIYIPYFALRGVIILDWRLGRGFSLDDISRDIEWRRRRGESIYFLSEVASVTPTVKDLAAFHQFTAEDYEMLLNHFHFGESIPLNERYALLPVEE
jgi:hypothetical protein